MSVEGMEPTKLRVPYPFKNPASANQLQP